MKLLSTPEEIENAKILKESWKHPGIPQAQWKSIEVERAYVNNGEFYKVPPFKAFIEACHWISDRELREEMDVLDAGCSTGLYAQILQAGGYGNWSYTGMDYSPAFKDFAGRVYPWLHVDLGDVLDMPYSRKTFKIVVGSFLNLHVEDWKKAIAEYFRVARKYIILHRIQLTDKPTEMYEHEAYGVKLLHTHVNNEEFNAEILKYNPRTTMHYIKIHDTSQHTVVVNV